MIASAAIMITFSMSTRHLGMIVQEKKVFYIKKGDWSKITQWLYGIGLWKTFSNEIN